MNLTKIKNECYDAMVEAIKSEIGSEGIDWAYNACATVDTNDGFIELVITIIAMLRLLSSMTMSTTALCYVKLLRKPFPTGMQ